MTIQKYNTLYSNGSSKLLQYININYTPYQHKVYYSIFKNGSSWLDIESKTFIKPSFTSF